MALLLSDEAKTVVGAGFEGGMCPGGSVRGVLSWRRHSALRGRCGRGHGIYRFGIQRQDSAGNKVGNPQSPGDVYS